MMSRSIRTMRLWLMPGTCTAAGTRAEIDATVGAMHVVARVMLRRLGVRMRVSMLVFVLVRMVMIVRMAMRMVVVVIVRGVVAVLMSVRPGMGVRVRVPVHVFMGVAEIAMGMLVRMAMLVRVIV